MGAAVWRASADDFDVDSFLEKFPGLQPDVVWHKGEKRLSKGFHMDSGFNMTLGETEDLQVLLEQVGSALETWRSALHLLHEHAVQMALDFSLVVGAREHFTQQLSFTPEELQLFSELGLTLVVSAYPWQD